MARSSMYLTVRLLEDSILNARQLFNEENFMQQRQNDPRDPKSTNNQVDDSSMNASPPVKPQADKPTSDNKYEFNQEEQDLWSGTSTDNAIARAWSRMCRRGHYLGKPTNDAIDYDGTLVQEFQYGRASLDNDDKRNPNKTVVFSDGHGEIGQDSGL